MENQKSYRTRDLLRDMNDRTKDQFADRLKGGFQSPDLAEFILINVVLVFAINIASSAAWEHLRTKIRKKPVRSRADLDEYESVLDAEIPDHDKGQHDEAMKSALAAARDLAGYQTPVDDLCRVIDELAPPS